MGYSLGQSSRFRQRLAFLKQSSSSAPYLLTPHSALLSSRVTSILDSLCTHPSNVREIVHVQVGKESLRGRGRRSTRCLGKFQISFLARQNAVFSPGKHAISGKFLQPLVVKRATQTAAPPQYPLAYLMISLTAPKTTSNVLTEPPK